MHGQAVLMVRLGYRNPRGVARSQLCICLCMYVLSHSGRNICIRQGKRLMWLTSMYWHFIFSKGDSGQGARYRKASTCSLPQRDTRTAFHVVSSRAWPMSD